VTLTNAELEGKVVAENSVTVPPEQRTSDDQTDTSHKGKREYTSRGSSE